MADKHIITIPCADDVLRDVEVLQESGGVAIHQSLIINADGSRNQNVAGFSVTHMQSGYRFCPHMLTWPQARGVFEYLVTLPIDWTQPAPSKEVCRKFGIGYTIKAIIAKQEK